jgi:hypothetical protein
MSSLHRMDRLGALTCALVALLAGAARGAHATAAPPVAPTALRCFGAASHDPAHHCSNPALRHVVFPTPTAALLLPYAPCSGPKFVGLLGACVFGTSKGSARGEIALVGDSHAGHWRAAVRDVAKRHGWRGTSISRSSCPFTTVALDLPHRARATCRRWNAEVIDWFRLHPEVHTVLVSDRARFQIVVPAGRSAVAARAAGYMAAGRALPATVTRILVIRDTPLRPLRTLDCVEHQIAVHGAAGTRCATPRRGVLPPDAATVAVRKLASERVHTIDLTRFFCSAKLCLPVIGGALVQKDETHMTTVFAASLAPYLMHRLDALISPETAAAPPDYATSGPSASR